MIPVFLQDLSLDSVLSSYCDDVGRYIFPSKQSEHIVDLVEKGISCFVRGNQGRTEDEEHKYFEIDNPNGGDFALLQLDHGMLPDYLTKCDCAIATDKECCFIEFKSNAFSANSDTVRNNYRKAMRQLSATIKIFRDGLNGIGKDLDKLREIEAYICLRSGYPRHTASEANYRFRFAEDNRVSLSFESKKTLHK